MDELTGLPADGNGMIIELRDGDYVEELFGPPFNGETFEGASERPGRYSITITSPLYVTWRLEGVRVREGDCHVETVHVTAELARAVTG